MTTEKTKPTMNSNAAWRRRQIRSGLILLAISVIGFFGIGHVLQPPPPESKNAALLTIGAIGSLLRIPFFMAGLLGLLILCKSIMEGNPTRNDSIPPAGRGVR